jgi:Fe-S cluster assembly protein SufD
MMEATLDRSRASAQLLGLSLPKPPNSPDWLVRLRDEAARSFERLGIPNRKEEGWRYTNLDPLVETEFHSPKPVSLDVGRRAFEENLFADLSCPRLVFINGHLVDALSALSALPTGVEVMSLAAAVVKKEDLLKNHLGRYASFREHAFNALNLALFQDGAFVHVSENTVVETPIELVFVTVGDDETAAIINPRVLVVAEKGSQLRVVESHLGLFGGSYFSNPVTELVAMDNAHLDYYKLEQESEASFHLGSVEANQKRDANIRTTLVTLAGGLVRNDTGATLDGEGGTAELDGLYLVGQMNHVDNFTRIEHASPNCDSRELYKGILMDKATGAFRGRIVVNKGAQKTDSKQTNNNLLLSNDALINTKPQLEIYADDVKCTHGATIGQLDGESVFYLRSRGISLDAARSILIYAFASEVVNRVKVEPLRAALDKYLFEWLPMGRVVKEAF